MAFVIQKQLTFFKEIIILNKFNHKLVQALCTILLCLSHLGPSETVVLGLERYCPPINTRAAALIQDAKVRSF